MLAYKNETGYLLRNCFKDLPDFDIILVNNFIDRVTVTGNFCSVAAVIHSCIVL